MILRSGKWPGPRRLTADFTLRLFRKGATESVSLAGSSEPAARRRRRRSSSDREPANCPLIGSILECQQPTGRWRGTILALQRKISLSVRLTLKHRRFGARTVKAIDVMDARPTS